MSSNWVVVLATISIVLNTAIFALILAAVLGLRRTLSRLDESMSRLAVRAEQELSATLQDFRGVAVETRGLLRSGGRLVENMAFASILGRAPGGDRLSQVVMGFNLAQKLVRLLSRRGDKKAASTNDCEK